jgi:CO dehydrogenase/acetyl-CoA synthase alpha subunit
MRLEIVLFIGASLWVAHIYSEGKYLKQLLTYKKYYQMGGVILGFFILCWLLRKTPQNTRDVLLTTGEYIKHLPMDRNMKSVLDFTMSAASSRLAPAVALPDNSSVFIPVAAKSNTSTIEKSKRSVSEGKKKYVASRQGWKCRECQDILPATFEVDHIQRLQHGGSNELENLQALCPNCHRSKTMLESML